MCVKCDTIGTIELVNGVPEVEPCKCVKETDNENSNSTR